VPDVHQWLTSYVADRYGKKDEYALKAWNEMLETVYNTNKQNGTFLCERPGFYDPKMAYRTSPIPDYDSKILEDALRNLLKCSDEFRKLDTYKFDLVNLTRQYISPLAFYWILDLKEAYSHNDLQRFLIVKNQFMSLISDFDLLLSSQKEYLLGRWIEDAKRWGENDQEKALYEWNARNIITMWGEKCTEGEFDDLNNYSYKQWAGMFSSYHSIRWSKFFDQIESDIRKHREWDRAPFLKASSLWEKSWSHERNTFSTITDGDPVEISRSLLEKYSPYYEQIKNK
jgi:alpha-N-acetylglucosaminidase